MFELELLKFLYGWIKKFIYTSSLKKTTNKMRAIIVTIAITKLQQQLDNSKVCFDQLLHIF